MVDRKKSLSPSLVFEERIQNDSYLGGRELISDKIGRYLYLFL